LYGLTETEHQVGGFLIKKLGACASAREMEVAP
jgi:hypothetical protein